MIGLEQSRRDDLESLGYAWMYLLRGSLPWQGLSAKTQGEKMRKITETKEGTKLGDLCKGLPAELHEYFRRVRNLKFEEQPNYLGLKTLFRDLFVRRGFVFDYAHRDSLTRTPASPFGRRSNGPALPRPSPGPDSMFA